MSTAFHQFGRDHLTNAWVSRFGRDPELHEIQLVQAVALGEGGYGQAAYKNAQTGETAVLNNWGATQCKHGPPCGDSCFEVTDRHADGSPYQWCYNRYATPSEGAAAYLGILQKIVDRSDAGFFGALSSASVDTFVRSMKEGGYFELALAKYQANVWKHVQSIASAMGEGLAVQKEEGSVVDADPFLRSLQSPPGDTEPSASPATFDPDAEVAKVNTKDLGDCYKREAYLKFNADGDPTNDISFYPEDD